MPKFFVFSDIHSYYDEFIKELNKSGYDENNPDHYLIGLGDYFDRGPGANEMYDFLMSHKERTILIKGNHDDLLQEMLQRGFPETHDSHNRTDDTVNQLSHSNWERNIFGTVASMEEFTKACKTVSEKIDPLYNRMVNYYETKHYVFVHGFIPLKRAYDTSEDYSGLPKLYRPTITKYKKDWRKATELEWEQARWTNGISYIKKENVKVPRKTIVVGHWHCSWGHAIDNYYKDLKTAEENNTEDQFSYDFDNYEFGPKADFSPYYCDGGIAIDACTAYSHKVNILVLEDELLDTAKK